MKRSEMTKLLRSKLIDLYRLDLSTEERAEFILRVIEEAGMLPPETKATIDDFVNTGFDQKFIDEHDFTVNRWELEEDEQRRKVLEKITPDFFEDDEDF